jgi:hypothetical protein
MIFSAEIHIALRASHAALPILTSKFRPKLAFSMLTPKFHQIPLSQG